jgi:hypothetical protein
VRRLRIGTVCLDSGGHHTQQVYRFCNTYSPAYLRDQGADGGRPICPRRTGKAGETPVAMSERLGRILRRMRSIQNLRLKHLARLLSFSNRISAGVLGPTHQRASAHAPSCAAIRYAIGLSRQVNEMRRCIVASTRCRAARQPNPVGEYFCAPRRLPHRRQLCRRAASTAGAYDSE